MSRFWRLGRVLPLVVLALPLKAQDTRLIDRFPPVVARRFLTVIDSAGREGLPIEPLVLRALEGGAKRATPDQIDGALRRLRDALLSAKLVLGPAANPAELTTAAAALQAGVAPGRLAELHQLRSGMPVTAPLGAYLDLIARGAQADRVWSRISDLARRRASDAEFVRLTPMDVDRDPPVHPPTGPSPRGS